MSRRPLVGGICCMRNPEDPVQGVAERYLLVAPFVEPTSCSFRRCRISLTLVRSSVGWTASCSREAPPTLRRAFIAARTRAMALSIRGRDETAFRLISESVEQNRPVLGICRGFQEIAVAYGATLRRDLGETKREQIHHTAPGLSLQDMFALEHQVDLASGGILERAMGAPSIVVNSAHFQGVSDLGNKLIVEATSSDGVVEGIRPSSGERVLAV